MALRGGGGSRTEPQLPWRGSTHSPTGTGFPPLLLPGITCQVLASGSAMGHLEKVWNCLAPREVQLMTVAAIVFAVTLTYDVRNVNNHFIITAHRTRRV